MTIADTGAPAHVIGAEAGAAAGAEAGAEVGAGMNINQVHLGTQTKRRQLLRAT